MVGDLPLRTRIPSRTFPCADPPLFPHSAGQNGSLSFLLPLVPTVRPGQPGEEKVEENEDSCELYTEITDLKCSLEVRMLRVIHVSPLSPSLFARAYHRPCRQTKRGESIVYMRMQARTASAPETSRSTFACRDEHASLDGTGRQHLLPQVVLVLSNRTVPRLDGLVLADQNFLCDPVE